MNERISKERVLYLRKNRNDKLIIVFSRIALLIALLGAWELFAYLNLIDPFITSSPSRVAVTIKNLFINDNFIYHIAITLYETILGFLLAVAIGYMVALILWWSEKTRRILEPYIVVLNSLPKIALGPIIIIWLGSGERSI
ncbi:MAG: ABC transporter permease, partial [Clostridia bacterium]|nr:ABC transporter permease [Clostridia bacterium]